MGYFAVAEHVNSMIKFLHIRALDESNRIATSGGVSVAYTCTKDEICMAVAACHDNDHFNYEIGRRITRGRLKSPKCEPIIIPLKHPITATIVEYLMLEWFEVPISIYLDDKFRWVSDFIPDDGVEVETDWAEMTNLQIPPSEDEVPHIPDDAYIQDGEIRYDG